MSEPTFTYRDKIDLLREEAKGRAYGAIGWFAVGASIEAPAIKYSHVPGSKIGMAIGAIYLVAAFNEAREAARNHYTAQTFEALPPDRQQLPYNEESNKPDIVA